MKLSQRGVDFIAGWEVFSAKAYDDGGGVWTIGYGHTRDVKEGDVITHERAISLLQRDTMQAEHDVNMLTIDIPLTQSMFDALVSLCFNIGVGNFAGSTLLKHLQAHDYLRAAHEFTSWYFDNKKPLLGLQRRRAAETVLFLSDNGMVV